MPKWSCKVFTTNFREKGFLGYKHYHCLTCVQFSFLLELNQFCFSKESSYHNDKCGSYFPLSAFYKISYFINIIFDSRKTDQPVYRFDSAGLENPSKSIMERSRFFDPALSNPLKPLFPIKPLDATTSITALWGLCYVPFCLLRTVLRERTGTSNITARTQL